MGGRPIDPTRMSWDVSGDCMNSVHVELWGRQERRPKKLSAASIADLNEIMAKAYLDRGTYTVEMETRCRRCKACLATRASAWRLRAKYELSLASRTWFGTLTLTAHHQFIMGARASKRLRDGGTDWNKLTESEQFRERHREIGVELTKWLKRIRKESGASLRYILVAEAHKSGLPHYHVLVHEVFNSLPVSERTLRKQWLLGFSKFNLVREGQPAAHYVCKYLSKAALARVRASVAYGKTPEWQRKQSDRVTRASL